jgi:hypothetical protein
VPHYALICRALYLGVTARGGSVPGNVGAFPKVFARPDRSEGMAIEGAKIDSPACPTTGAEHIFAVRLIFAGIVKHLTTRAGDIKECRSMSLLTASIESTHLTRWNFGLGALTLLGVFAIALALILP